MRVVKLGQTDISVSRLGIGTGTAHPSGRCFQALIREQDFADLLLYGFERGITLWDSAAQYQTYRHIRCALKVVPRQRVAISTKLIVSTAVEAERGLTEALREINTDYIDMCLLHAVRTRGELKRCEGALEKLVRLREKGLIRAVGISCHGISALEAARDCPDIDVVWCRINHAGLHMDRRLGLVDRLAALPLIKKKAKHLPAWCIARLRPGEASPIREDEHSRITALLQQLHAKGKGLVGMKIMAQGALASDPQAAINYAAGRAFLDSFIIGMLNRSEIDVNCRALELYESRFGITDSEARP
jgi:aryl-alcohol dehydrogenase-like predicted oxidoreductase